MTERAPGADLEDVIARYRATTLANPLYWNVRRKRVADPEREALENAAGARTLGAGNAADVFMQEQFPGNLPKDITFAQFKQAYLHAMRDDIVQCLTPDQMAFFESVHLRFLPTGLTNACCVNADITGKPLGFHIAFVNEGLYFALNQLVTALIFEEMQGDLSHYKRDGSAAFEAAIRLYLEPTSTNIDTVPLSLDDPAATGEVQAYQASAVTLILTFVCLHEFAHAWLGHHRAVDTARLSLVEPEEDVTAGTVSETAKTQEFEADAFAFAALTSRTRTPESNWAHAFLIHLFFCYLDAIETRIGRPLSTLHPPPQERSRRIVLQFSSAFPGNGNWQAEIELLVAQVASWTKSKQ